MVSLAWKLRILEDVGDVEDRRDRRAGLRELVDHLLGVALGDPRADDRVELVLVLEPTGVAREPLLGHHVAASDRRTVRSAVDWLEADMPSQTPSLLKYRLRGARERRSIAGATLDQAELVVDGALRPEHAEQGSNMERSISWPSPPPLSRQ